MAARLRRELGIDVDMVRGHYGEFQQATGVHLRRPPMDKLAAEKE